MHEPACPPDRLGQSGEEHLAIIVIGKDPLLPVAPAHHMVSRSGILDPNLTWHASDCDSLARLFKIFLLTPDP
jgi:hypothetical protein